MTVTIHRESDHLWAEVAELPGCFASGRDLAELGDALAEAIDMYADPASSR
jgi:predicted RNase H-like HicB family nuclease